MAGLYLGQHGAAISVLTLLVLVTPAHAGLINSVTFTKIADTATAIPDGTGNFTAFRFFPSIDNGTVAFLGQGSAGQEGIYTGNGTLDVVADRNTAVPGGTGNFTAFDGPTIDDGTVAFFGGGGRQAGIYIGNGAVDVVADENTAIPGGTGNFIAFGVPVIDNGTVAFFGTGEPFLVQEGIYTGNGALDVVADDGTAVPGGTGNFLAFGPFPSIDNGTVAFLGLDSAGQEGIYTGNGTLDVIADTNTAIPDGTGNFTAFRFPSIDNGTVAFLGQASAGQAGIYTGNGTLDVIADTNTAIPDGTGNFTDFGAASIDKGTVSFLGRGGGGQEGIYIDLGMGVEKVIDLTDVLDGKALSEILLFVNNLSGDQIAFGANFSDESVGIYVANISRAAVPEPATRVLMGLGLAVIAFGRRRRQKPA